MKKQLLTITAALALSMNAFGEDFVIGVEDMKYYPIYDNEAGEYKGYARDLLDQFAKDSGHTFKYSVLPINRLFKALTAGQVDFKFPDNEHWQTDAKKGFNVVYTNGLFTNIDGLHVLPAKAGKGFESIKVIGTILGFTPWPYFDKIQAGQVKVTQNTSADGLINQGMIERVDGVYLSVYVIDYALKQAKKDGALVFDKTLPYSKDDYKLSTTKYAKVAEDFNTWLAKNQELIVSLKTKYGIEKDLEK
jgi:polar amino acid transport system substrate-binding protein